MDANTFWSSLEKPDGDSGCWIWTKSKTPQGYGRVYYPPKGNVYTHRLAYELVKGPISEGLHVCHACDNPPYGLSADKNSIRAIAAYRSGAIKRVALGRIHTVQQLKLLELLHRRAEIARQAGLSDDDIFKAVA